MKKDPVIVYYVSSHGFGHAARTCDVLQALIEKVPSVDLHIVTGVPTDFFFTRVPRLKAAIHSKILDVGMIQHDSIQIDVARTLNELNGLYSRCSGYLENETGFLKTVGADLVVSDIVPLSVAAAKQIDIPAVVVANFTWDWIYEKQSDTSISMHPIVDLMRTQYAKADLLVELPFACPMDMFHRRVCVGLLAKRGTCRRDTIAQTTGGNPHKNWALLAFKDLDLQQDALVRMAACSEVEWFSVDPLSWPDSGVHVLNRRDFVFPDILASVDAAISKPGFGIVSECLANQLPLVYTDRENFAEYVYLEAGIRRYLKHSFVSQHDLYHGVLEKAVREAMAAPPPEETISGNGAVETAEQVLSCIGS